MKQPSPRQLEALNAVSRGRFYPSLLKEDDGWHARWKGLDDDNPWIDETVRSATITPLSADAENQRHETLHDAWLEALRSRTGLVVWDDAECGRFADELNRWSGNAEEDSLARASIVFKLNTAGENFSVSCRVKRSARILRQLGQAAYLFPSLKSLRASGRENKSGVPLAVELSRAEAESFLRRGARDLSLAGYSVEGCDISASVSASAEVGEAAEGAASSNSYVAKLQIRVDGEAVDAEEIRFLLEQKSSLVFFRDRWIEVDRNVLKEALKALEKQDGKTLKVNEALAFASGIGFAGRMHIEEAAMGGWLRGLVSRLKAAGEGILDFSSIDGFVGQLRAYQLRGVAWIRFLTENGFGALLADDMGLGKTIQTIAWILSVREKCDGPALVIAPLTLLSNWKHEFAKFAPGLKVYVHQGSARQLEYGFKRESAKADVVITSYNLLVKDYQAVRRVEWSSLVLDEAQAIKNPDTRAARAAIALGVPKRLALTGTPIENSVADVWSLENFLNPGFLGDRKSFEDRFVKPIRQDEKSIAGKRLSRALEPFILRRTKDDRTIAGELSEKHEIKEYCALSPQARAAYEQALEDYRAGERRHGDMFALITRLKLICDGAGKFERLFDLLESIFASGESALIFTQYAKVGDAIRKALSRKFNRVFPYLHGALSAAARQKEIDGFNSSTEPSAFILSLRAGAFGLNLVKASHVIHFDRWWNPAVESQATDRAHRIGQTKTVFVHSFVTEGTLEERIDSILERKARVAGTLVGTGEGFLKSLSSEEFEEIVALDPGVERGGGA
ncbi:MAG: DEAD/DEAH box helicase [Kiritimatiellae bacterium]|nr:DEAD/DEAH box helicase [Kiritimatiellia bacterium]